MMENDLGIFKITTREAQVLTCLMAGKTNPEIAQRLGISASTVSSHLKNLMTKTQTRTRTHLVCMLSMIQGVYCHETGCPANAKINKLMVQLEAMENY